MKTSTDFNTFVHAMQQQCATLLDRMAIFDLYDSTAVTKANADANLPACVGEFQTAVSALNGSGLSYGAAYFPFLNTTVLAPTSLSAANLVLPEGNTFTAQDVQQLLAIVAQKEGVLPSSAAIAGVYTANDQERGVWIAPANMVLASVTAPTVALTDVQQSGLNLPLNGLAVNVTRTFVNRGTVVWGARTLDGNSTDWRYIQVRRNIIYIEQSIKIALQAYTFAPNVSATWVSATSQISNFLQGLWSQGGLMGDKASDAFTVQCGLGSTMTGEDIVNGIMVVSVTLQMVHPAEFMQLSFTQKMQTS